MGSPRSEIDGDADGDVVGDRGRLLEIGMATVFGSGVIFGVLRGAAQLISGKSTPWWANIGAAVVVAALYAWVRVDPQKRVGIGVHGTALVATLALLVPAAYGMTTSKWWLTLVAFSVLLMGRRREAIVWTTATLVLVPLTAELEPYIAIQGAIGESPIERAVAMFLFLVVLLGVTWAFRRVAQQRAATLSETAASLARANEVRGRFLAHMSHELRTPLHGVIAMTDLALQGTASAGVREQVATAQQSARVLLELLNNILDVTRADADAIELQERPFALHALLTEILRPFEVRAREKGVVLEAIAEPSVVESRIGDRVRVSQIVINLVSNALKFTSKGTISVHLRESIDDREVIEISVTDTGQGISDANLPRIFEPFAHFGGSGKEMEKGAGLGLAIVRELTKRMGGGIGVTTKEGSGTKFEVSLRLPREHDEEKGFGPEALLAARATAVSIQVSVAPSPKRVLSILVCEDDPVSQRVALLMLKRLGHDVTTADDGLTAWEILREREFDLLLTDIEMPGLDGLALTRRVREREESENRSRLPVVAATAHVGEDERHRLLGAGVDVHVPKPFTMAILTSALEPFVGPGA